METTKRHEADIEKLNRMALAAQEKAIELKRRVREFNRIAYQFRKQAAMLARWIA